MSWMQVLTREPVLVAQASRPKRHEGITPTTVQLTKAQWDRLRELGGTTWVRQQLAREDATPTQKPRAKVLEQMYPTSVHLTLKERDRLNQLGGVRWLRETLDLA